MLSCSGLPSRSLSANIFPATLNTDTSSPNGKSSTAPGRARHAALSSCASTTQPPALRLAGMTCAGPWIVERGGHVSQLRLRRGGTSRPGGGGLAAVIARRQDLAAGRLGAFRQQQQCADEGA